MVVQLSTRAFERFSHASRERWIASAAADLHAAYRDHLTAIGVGRDDLEPLCAGVEEWARGHGITGDRDLQRLCIVAMTLGHRFWRDPRFRTYVKATVANSAMATSRRADALVDRTAQWLERLWVNDSADAFYERLAAALSPPPAVPDDPAQLATLLPGHAELFTPRDGDLIAAMLARRCEEEGLSRADQRLAGSALALVHGFDWWDDPHHRELSTLVRTAPEASALAEGLRAHARVVAP